MTRTVLTPTGTYLTVEGDQVRSMPLVVVPLVDEWTGEAPEQVRAASLTPWINAHVTDGRLVLTGLPGRALPHLATASQSVTVTLQRRGRRAYDVELVVPMGAVLPWWGPPVALESTVIAVAGKVREVDFPHAAVAGAAVEIRGAAGQALIALRAPLALAHEAALTVGRRGLTQTGVANASAAPAGAIRIAVTPTTGIANGTVLAFGTLEREEHATVAGVEPGDVVVLKVPLVRTVVAGTPVRRFTQGGLSAATQLSRGTLPGDGVLLTAAASTADVLEVSDADRTELRSTGLLTDSGGGWRLDGVRGIPRVALTISAAGLTTVGPVIHPLNGASDPNVLDVDLPA